ncbi:MAG: hypothetical protein HY974_04135 [Candidatus Kerfeldbacteria bacterium]|nr:hypothetical protein [Candidatus Kerfeldbacteria bacterium]
MAIPYVIFLGLYVIGLIMLLVFGLSSLYHLLRYGFFTPTSVFMTFLLIAGTALILFISYQHIGAIDWGRSFDVELFAQSLNPF